MSKPFLGASKRRPCPLCGRKSWPCYWRPDESVVWCKTVLSEKTDRQGNYCHVLKFDSARPRSAAVALTPDCRRGVASSDHLHLVYSALLSRLSLRPEHFNKLSARGLSPEAIEANGYRSTPAKEECDAIAEALAPLGLAGVPGFFFCGRRWRLRWPSGAGFYVPYRTGAGLIAGLSYRLDNPPLDERGRLSGKYRWLSTNPEDTTEGGVRRWPGGTKLTPPVHVAGRHLLASSAEILLTEGALKGDVAAHLLGVPLLCAAGVHQWGKGFAERFKQQFPNRRAVLAYDSDWRSNPHVRHALETLMAALRDAGVLYAVRSWPRHPESKGIDDLALSQSNGEVRAA